MNDLTTTGVSFDYSMEPSKKEIIQRLFEAGHITFNEMWTLLLDEPDVKYVPMPPHNPNPIITPYPNPDPNPWNPNYPWTISIGDDNNNQRLHITYRGAGDIEKH